MPATPTSDRILDAAVQLFAEHGYRGTTVGAIEQAAGLAPRRGGLYRHFASKEQLFHAAVAQCARRFGPLEDRFANVDVTDVPAALADLADATIEGLAAERDLLRLVQRDAAQFPALAASVHEQLLGRGYRLATRLFRRLLASRGLPDADAAGLAVIALGALVRYAEEIAVHGRPPADVARDDVVRIWADTWVQVLDARQAAAGGEDDGRDTTA